MKTTGGKLLSWSQFLGFSDFPAVYLNMLLVVWVSLIQFSRVNEYHPANFPKFLFWTSLSQQWPGENLLASRDYINANGDGKSLAFNRWGFQILLFTDRKIRWVSRFDARNFSVILIGMRVQCSSTPIGIEFQSTFLTGTMFFADFLSMYGVPPSLWYWGVFGFPDFMSQFFCKLLYCW